MVQFYDTFTEDDLVILERSDVAWRKVHKLISGTAVARQIFLNGLDPTRASQKQTAVVRPKVAPPGKPFMSYDKTQSLFKLAGAAIKELQGSSNSMWRNQSLGKLKKLLEEK